MLYRKAVTLKDGRTCIIRHGTEADAAAALANFIRTHEETDYLASYPDEITYTEEQEAKMLKDKAESPWDAELLAEVDGRIVGLAGIDRISAREKARHRANFGISIEKAYWGLGIGRALTRACLECAKEAGYTQVELDVVAENTHAIALYESEGFTEYGRNPLGFRSRVSGFCELVLMRREL